MHSEWTNSLVKARHLDASGKHEEALAAFLEFLEIHPESTEGWVDCAGLLLVLGRLGEAQEAIDRALCLEPMNYGARVHSACILMHHGHLHTAEAAFRKAIALEPGRIAGRLMLSDCLMREGDLVRTRALLEDVLAQEPHHPIALDRLNTVMICLGDWQGVRHDMARQVSRYSGAEAEYVASHLDLMFGDMPRGWQRFEARLEIPGRKPQRSYPQPRWKGEPFHGRTLLLTWEQGYGDTLMFMRFAPLAKALGGSILFEVQPALEDLARTCPGIDEVIPSGQPLPPFDFHLSVLSLPALFKTSLASIPADIPYLGIPPFIPEQEGISKMLSMALGQTRIGVCWAGNANYARDAKRSIPPAALAPLGALPDVAWYSFQFDKAEDPPLPSLHTLGSLLKGFPNTAFALQGMDLLITVDTVLAHLAGALGIPTFLLLSFVPDWRWMMGRNDSPWYPSLRLYRQSSPGDWGPVMLQLVRDLTQPETP
jgi:tetratricopeptide (TPR) repeat protein